MEIRVLRYFSTVAREGGINLKRIRGNLMDELHCKQQLVDQVDYMIYKLKSEQKQ
ncbi:MAG: hypothetical protein LUE16_11285 [Lachnospiraceae bacterium]|nr:hypothetical protein [Lachnospiraceae bacterium]